MIKVKPQFVKNKSELDEYTNSIMGKRDAIIKGIDGEVVFSQKGVEFPTDWSDTAVNITANKYLRKANGEKEYSIKQTVNRIVDQITNWGIKQEYFDSKNANIFNANLKYIMYSQRAAFNSPVFFNLGIPGAKQQISACFILKVEDSIESITESVKIQSRLFVGGSGAGQNYSNLRGVKERLSGGGWASGPLSFIKGHDSFAGIIKSGGTTRRAARMVILNADHPDIMLFIDSKVEEEKKARALIAAGYNGAFDDENGAYATVAYQNGNHSIMASDKFMQAVVDDGDFELVGRVDSSVNRTVKARDIFERACKAAWEVGDPALMFEDAINDWHTTPKSGKIESSNPCFRGDMKLRTKDGDKTFSELSGKTVDILSGNGRFEEATVFSTGVKQIVKLTLSNGQELFCTKDHRFLTDGIKDVSGKFHELKKRSYVEARSMLGRTVCLAENLFNDEPGEYQKVWVVDYSILEEEEVFDFTEPVTHAGVVEGLVVHNCGEYVDIPNSACNLASLNISKFLKVVDGKLSFLHEDFVYTTKMISLAQEIMVDPAFYPTEDIRFNTINHRQLGLGFANLGGSLMRAGIGYDSDEGRSIAAGISSLMTSSVYEQSQEVASVLGPFNAFEKNAEDVSRVITKHLMANGSAMSNSKSELTDQIFIKADKKWREIIKRLPKTGIRNSKATVIAPTGTISFFMDCDTTGIEPETGLVKYKNMVGGGVVKIANSCLVDGLASLNYDEESARKIVEYIEENDSIEGCPEFKSAEDLSVFDCAYGAGRVLSSESHIKMMAAVQPFISGAISKTVSMKNESTPKDVEKIYMDAWKMGLKGITIYRDGAKESQPLTFKKAEGTNDEISSDDKNISIRRPMPDTVKTIRHSFSLGGQKMFLHIGFYKDGTIGEIFVRTAKGGSTMNGLLDSFAVVTSMALQQGVPVERLIRKLSYTNFEPSGFTGNRSIGLARSPVDYIVRYLEGYITKNNSEDNEDIEIDKNVEENTDEVTEDKNSLSEVFCSICGGATKRSGTCHVCTQCGQTTGCS